LLLLFFFFFFFFFFFLLFWDFGLLTLTAYTSTTVLPRPEALGDAAVSGIWALLRELRLLDVLKSYEMTYCKCSSNCV